MARKELLAADERKVINRPEQISISSHILSERGGQLEESTNSVLTHASNFIISTSPFILTFSIRRSIHKSVFYILLYILGSGLLFITYIDPSF